MPNTEYLLRLNVTVEGPRQLTEADIYDILAAMATKLYDGATIKCEYARCEADWLMFLLTGKGSIANEAVDNDIVNYSGQGRNKYGK